MWVVVNAPVSVFETEVAKVLVTLLPVQVVGVYSQNYIRYRPQTDVPKGLRP